MKTLFVNKNEKMIPDYLQPIVDKVGITLTGVATFLNVQLGFLGGSFDGFLLSPVFNSLLTIIISLLSILWILMKIYDQWLTTRLKKEAITGVEKVKRKRRFRFFKRKK